MISPSIKVIALILSVLLLGVIADSKTAYAATPTMDVEKDNPVPGSGFGGQVETEWANIGTTLEITITDADLGLSPNDGGTQEVEVTITTEESDVSTGPFDLQESSTLFSHVE